MMTSTKTLLAVSRLLGVSVEDMVKDAALRVRVVKFLKEIQQPGPSYLVKMTAKAKRL